MAGISRGGYLHHFPKRAFLLAEATKYLADKRLSEFQEEFRRLPPHEQNVDAALDLMWRSFTGPGYQAFLELWVAARTDGDLGAALAAVEPQTGRRLLDTFRTFFPAEVTARPTFETHLLLTLNAMRGMAAVQIYDIDGSTQIRHWERMKPALHRLFTAGTQDA